MSGAAGAGAAAAIAAAKHAEKMRKEEEQMATYGKEDLDGWEFKIVRTNTEYFRKPENLRKVIEEEAKAGWEMVEKFDNSRVRFKRKTDMRKNDQFLDIDPYRTQLGMGSGPMVALILGIIAAATGIIVFAVGKTSGEFDFPITALMIGILLITVLVALIIKKSR